MMRFQELYDRAAQRKGEEALAERLPVVLDAGALSATDDDRMRHPHIARIAANVVGDLHGQLAGWR